MLHSYLLKYPLQRCSKQKAQRFVMPRYVRYTRPTALHNHHCQITSSKAAKAEFAKEYDQAFRLYIKAAESFLHLSRSGGTQDKIKQQWKANASKALERAERIKKFVEKSTTASSNVQSPSLRLTPVAINHFSPRKPSLK